MSLNRSTSWLWLIAGTGLFFFLVDPAYASEPGLWQKTVFYIREQQQLFHRQLASAIKAMQEGGLVSFWGMVSVSFLYGVFHAAGPGHGKAIIGTYLLSQESDLKKGVGLSFASALMQGIVAVVVIEGLVGIVGWTSRQARDLAPTLEMVSFGLIGAIGLMLIWRAIRGFLRMRASAHSHHHDHDHPHSHDHGEGECETCGHSHAPSPNLIKEGTSWRDTFAIIISIGIRPCSGAILVLVFAEVLGMRWAGITSVMAISLGTAMTVSALAFVTVYFRKFALSLLETQGGHVVSYAALLVTFGGGVLISLLSWSLVMSAYQSPHPLF